MNRPTSPTCPCRGATLDSAKRRLTSESRELRSSLGPLWYQTRQHATAAYALHAKGRMRTRGWVCARVSVTQNTFVESSLHRQLCDPCESATKRPLRDLFTSAHNAISFYFAPPRYRLRSHNAAGWAAMRKKKREKGVPSVPFSTFPRLRVNQSQVDFSTSRALIQARMLAR